MTIIGTLFVFAIVIIGVVVLRYSNPAELRPFRTLFMPWLPILSALACFGLMTFLPFVTWIRFIVWSIIGVVLYFTYSMRRGRLNQIPQQTG